jgi:hypothetical protein
LAISGLLPGLALGRLERRGWVQRALAGRQRKRSVG